MNEFLEYDLKKKAINPLNLDDFSIEDLDHYITELSNEISRVDIEINKKKKLMSDAENYFK